MPKNKHGNASTPPDQADRARAKIRNTGYARAIEIAVRDLYGVDGINSDTYMQVSEKMKLRNKKGLYQWILKERSGIDISINRARVKRELAFFPSVFASLHTINYFILGLTGYTVNTIVRETTVGDLSHGRGTNDANS